MASVIVNMRSMLRIVVVVAALACMGCGGSKATQATDATVTASQSIGDPVVALPNAKDSFKFAVLGDFGTGSREQYGIGEAMAKLHETFPYETVFTVGDNLYGSQRAKDFERKFEIPYKPLLEAGVKFYAALGNHDIREQPSYKLFNMEGKLFYTVKPTDTIKFFMLDTTYPTPEQYEWIEKELTASTEEWKIVVFHHPLYSSGGRHGSDLALREKLEPLFVKQNVSVVLQGHDHFYERIKPQKGIVYFVAGSGGKLRKGDIDERSGLTAKGFDTGLAFMAAEITGNHMYFNAITTDGSVVDSGIIELRKSVSTGSNAAAPPAKTQTTPRRP